MSALIEKAQAAMLSEVFALTQPDRGDVFSWLDDHSEAVARAVVTAVAFCFNDTGTTESDYWADVLKGNLEDSK